MRCPEGLTALAALGTVEPVVFEPVRESNAAGWALLAVVAGLLIVELWLIGTGRPTISQWIARKTRGRPWWKAFGVVSIGLVLWHLFEGGPLSWATP